MSILQTKKNVVVETKTTGTAADRKPMFAPINYILMAAGMALMVLGYVLMVGGSSDANPAEFNAAEKYSFVRITLSPILILAGLALQIPAILWRAKQ